MGCVMQSQIHIILAPDKNYAIHAGVAMLSVLNHAAQPTRFHFYYLQGENPLSGDQQRKSEQIVKQYGAQLSFVQVKGDWVKRLGKLGPDYITAAAYYRLLIPSIFPQLERCIYLDCDLVALGDLTELWDMDISTAGIGAVEDCFVEREGLQKYPEIEHYFNSGVLYMNLDRWRKLQYSEKCLRLAADAEMRERFADQDVLNVALSKDVIYLHPRWNIQTGQKPLFSSKRLREARQAWREICQAPKIAHFTSSKKPWNMGMKHNWSMEYWRMLSVTPWKAELKNLPKLIWRAKLNRLKALISRGSRWLLTFKKNTKKQEFRISVCGRLVIDRKCEILQTH
jgi:lipopolysaccharide biosynthesis glycosyltransferase